MRDATCERCGRTAPTAGAEGHVPWEATVREDRSITVICPECLAKVDSAAIDEGRIWSEFERLPPEDLGARGADGPPADAQPGVQAPKRPAAGPGPSSPSGR